MPPRQPRVRKTAGGDVLADAIRCAELGWRIHPTFAEGPAAKRPRIRDWPNLASSEPKRIKNWYGTFSVEDDGCAFGLACGSRSNVFVVDVDKRDDGLERWRALVEKNGALPRTPSAKSGSGGLHYYFAWPDGLTVGNSAGSVAKGVDVRGEGGHVVLPPSPHPSGTPYEWNTPPWEVAPAMAPAWLLKLVGRAGRKKNWKDLEVEWEPGEQEAHIYHHGHEWGMSGHSLETIIAAMVRKLADGGIPTEEGKEPWGEDAVVEKVTRGWEDGKAQRESTLQGMTAPPDLPNGGDGAGGRLAAGLPGKFSHPLGLDDQDNAVRFARLHLGKVIYSTGVGWMTWDGARWRPDPEEITVMRLAREVGDLIMAEALTVGGNQRPRLMQWAQQSLNIGRAHAMLTFARGYLEVRADELDADPWALNFSNGTLDLRTGELGEHDPANLITKIIHCDYDLKAKCPTWLQTMGYAFGKKSDVANHLRAMLGYSMTGLQDQQALFICWGPEGSNGKSTLMESFRRMMGEYSGSADADMLMGDRTTSNAQSMLAGLRGTRFVLMSEASERTKLDSATVKSLTGGDTITATAKYQNTMQYRPNFKLWILTNELPAISDMGPAMWRRVRPIPFDRVIPAEVRRPSEAVAADLDGEWAGIAAWAVSGLLDLQSKPEAERWAIPQAVEETRNEYKSASDLVRQFLDEECEFGDEHQSGKKTLYSAYQYWCKRSGIKVVMTSNMFLRRLKKLPGLTVSQERDPKTKDYTVGGVKYRMSAMSEAMEGEDTEA